MPKGTMAHTCTIVFVWLIAVVSLGSTLTALMTDYWYQADTSDNVDPEVKKAFSFHFGLWRMCYDGVDMPIAVSEDTSYNKDGSSCVFIFKQLIQKNEEDLDYNSRLRIHLSRTVLGCSIACSAAILGSLLSLLLGLCHICCAQTSSKKPCVYLSASVLLLLASLCGIASGISFIALRDLDNTEVRTTISSSSSSSPVMPLPPALPDYVDQDYAWSFMLHWIGTGLCLVDSFLLLCLLHNSYQFVGKEGGKWSRYSSI